MPTEKKAGTYFSKDSNTRLKEHSIPACHASPTPYLTRTALVNLVTKLNHEACILWNWICTSKFTGKIDSLQKKTVLRQEISKTYLKCSLSTDWENCQNDYTSILLWIYNVSFLNSQLFFLINWPNISQLVYIRKLLNIQCQPAFLEQLPCAQIVTGYFIYYTQKCLTTDAIQTFYIIFIFPTYKVAENNLATTKIHMVQYACIP